MNHLTIETTILDYIEVNGRISKKLFEKIVTPKLRRLEKLESQNKKLIEALMFYADPNNWDYYDSITEGSDISENPSTRWNAVFLPDKNDSELLEGYGFLHEQAYVNGKLARVVLKEIENEH